MESIYWVPSRDCNQRCAHCYNDSEPGAPGLTFAGAARCVAHLPDPDDVPVDRIILSGGEVLVWPGLLCHCLDLLHARYGDGTALWLQTNADLLDRAMLHRLLEHHVTRIDVSALDRFHRELPPERYAAIKNLFRDAGLRRLEEKPVRADGAVYHFWGCTPDAWIGPVWPRGRAIRTGVSRAAPEDRFCAGWSGAKGFLDYRAQGSEVNIQLADVYPCCPMTPAPAGSLLEEPLTAILDRCAADPVFQALNRGDAESMGETLGFDESTGRQRSRERGNPCLWCDDFFTQHASHLLRFDLPTARLRPAD
jgi:hypothetical protein